MSLSGVPVEPGVRYLRGAPQFERYTPYRMSSRTLAPRNATQRRPIGTVIVGPDCAMSATGTAGSMASRGVRVTARDLRPGDVLVKEGWSVLAVERPMTDHATIRVTLVKPKSSRPFNASYQLTRLYGLIAASSTSEVATNRWFEMCGEGHE